jgi:hypothetical protein
MDRRRGTVDAWSEVDFDRHGNPKWSNSAQRCHLLPNTLLEADRIRELICGFALERSGDINVDLLRFTSVYLKQSAFGSIPKFALAKRHVRLFIIFTTACHHTQAVAHFVFNRL